jgi:stage V sporulation protein G
MESSEDRLRGFCSITFDDCFVVRDLKIIEGNNGPFVAMPSRKLTANCHKCRTKNHLRARHCNHCGAKLRNEVITQDADGRARLYADIAHPINAKCREMIQNRVIEEFYSELDLSKQPGYVSRYDDDYDSDWSNGPGRNHGDRSKSNDSKRVDKAEETISGGHADDQKSANTGGQGQSGQDSGTSFGQGIFD